jgi:NAD(P)-dependent dehydrogenase (short-subunit alcohol dehydrogenase family)
MVSAAGGEISTTAPLDAADPEAVGALIDAIATEFGGIDILYNNASEPRFGAVDEMSLEDWRYTIEHELSIAYYAARAAWPHLRERGGGAIVNIASVAGTIGVSGLPQSAHAAAKMGIVGMTRQLAAEGAPLGIRVNAVSPGLVTVPSTEPILAMGAEGPLGGILARLPLGRPGRPEEVVAAALFLASDEASYITGVNLMVDGGLTTLQ